MTANTHHELDEFFEPSFEPCLLRDREAEGDDHQWYLWLAVGIFGLTFAATLAFDIIMSRIHSQQLNAQLWEEALEVALANRPL